MKKLPDPITLDGLLTGTEEPGAPAWQALVSEAGGAEAWEAAVARRSRIDRMMKLAHKRPWLASNILAYRRAVRKVTRLLKTPIRLEPAPSLVTASLDVEPATPTRGMSWGATEVLELNLGETIAVRPPAGAQMFWRNPAGSGVLKRSWRMEAGDSPVLIVVAEPDPVGLESLDAAMGSGRSLALLVLVEREAGEKQG